MDSFIVFEFNNNILSPIGMIDDFVNLMFSKYATDTGDFELTIPYSQSKFDLVKRSDDMEKVILLEDNVAGICQKVNPIIDTDGRKIIIQGTLANGLLDNYCVGKVERLITATTSPQDLLNFPLSLQYIIAHPASNISGGLWGGIVYSLPSDYADASWEFVNGYSGGRCTFNKYIQNCIRQLDKMYSVDFNVNTNKFDLIIRTPQNRTVNQNVNAPVILSTKFGDILSSQYYLNSKDYKNIVVAYALINNEYYEQVVTYDSIEQLDSFPSVKKRVAYCEIAGVDWFDEQGDVISQEDIAGLLKQKGKEQLYDFALVSEYKCKFSQRTTFTFGVDYFLGDKITIQDTELGLVLDAEITGYTKTRSINGESFEPIVGIPQPTLTQMLKRKGIM